MGVREKVGVFDYQSGKSQGNLIDVLGMNPVQILLTVARNLHCKGSCDRAFIEVTTVWSFTI